MPLVILVTRISRVCCVPITNRSEIFSAPSNNGGRTVDSSDRGRCPWPRGSYPNRVTRYSCLCNTRANSSYPMIFLLSLWSPRRITFGSLSVTYPRRTSTHFALISKLVKRRRPSTTSKKRFEIPLRSGLLSHQGKKGYLSTLPTEVCTS